jgi:molybdopterin-guanine dinucleotide biosynthesis protein A
MGAPKANLPLGDISLIGAAVATMKLIFRQVFVVTTDKTSLLDVGV